MGEAHRLIPRTVPDGGRLNAGRRPFNNHQKPQIMKKKIHTQAEVYAAFYGANTLQSIPETWRDGFRCETIWTRFAYFDVTVMHTEPWKMPPYYVIHAYGAYRENTRKKAKFRFTGRTLMDLTINAYNFIFTNL